MRKKKFAILSAVLAMLFAFTFVFAACENGETGGGTVTVPGDPFEDYVEVPAEDSGSAPASIALNASALTVAYKGTATVQATVTNPVEGTVTWAVEAPAEGAAPIVIAEGETTQTSETSGSATVTLSGAAYTGDTLYTLTATFTAAGNANNTATAACEVKVGTRTVQVTAASETSALYSDGTEAEKSTQLTAQVVGLTADETATVSWAITEGGALADLSATTGDSVTLTAKDGADVGSVTVTASVTYDDGQTTEQTASGSATVSVTKHAMNNLATIDFDTNVSGTSVGVDSAYSGVTATLSDAASLQTSVAKAGNAMKVTGDTVNDDRDEMLSVSFDGLENLVGDEEAISFSFDYYLTGTGIGDWSSLVSIGQWDGMRVTFMNLWGDNGGWPGSGGVLQGSYQYDALSKAAPNVWHHLVVEMSKTDGIRFYLDGVLVCVYAYAGEAQTVVDAAYNWINGGEGLFVFFGDIEGGAVGSDLYVDNVRITKNITAADLYTAATAAN